MKLGLIVVCVILTFAIIFEFSTLSVNLGNLIYFFDLPSFLILIVPVIVLAIGAYSWETYGKTWSIPFGNPENCEQSELIEVNKCLNFMGNMSVMMGIIGTFIGVILSLNFLVKGADLTGSIALVVVSLFYGILFKALFMFATSKVEKYIK